MFPAYKQKDGIFEYRLVFANEVCQKTRFVLHLRQIIIEFSPSITVT